VRLSSVSLRNYRSFEKVDFELGDLNVLIGTNASGKSNIVSSLKLLRDYMEYGLNDVIARQGGPEYIFTKYSDQPEKETRLVFIFDHVAKSQLGPFEETNYTTQISKLKFDITLKSISEQIKDRLILTSRIQVSSKKTNERKQEVDFIINYSEGRFTTSLRIVKGNKSKLVKKKQIIQDYYPFLDFLERQMKQSNAIEKRETFLNSSMIFLNPRPDFAELGFYNFDPKVLKKPRELSYKAKLSEDGDNLAAVLNDAFQEKDRKKRIMLAFRSFYPAVKDIGVESSIGGSVIVRAEEEYRVKLKLPANFMSEGMLFVLMIITAINQEDKKIIVIEEPERYIHPSLIARLMNFFKSNSESKQIVITTHSPVVVENTELDQILVLDRKKDTGVTTIRGPKDNIDQQLIDEIGLGELFDNNLI